MTARISDEQATKIMVAAGAQPLIPYPGSAEPWRCQCLTCKNEIFPSYKSIKSGQGPCKFCAGFLTKTDAKKLLKTYGFKGLIDYPGANNPWKSTCLECGQTSSPSLSNLKAGSRCKFCMNAKNGRDKRTPEVTAINVMLENGFRPLVPYSTSSTPWVSKCLNCDRIVKPRLSSVRMGKRCVYCSERKIDESDAIEILKLAGARPLERYSSSAESWKSKCLTCFKEIAPRLKDVRKTGSACKYCAGASVDVNEALVLLDQKGLFPLVDYPGSSVPWKCICSRCGHKTAPTYSNLKNGSGGCRRCAGLLVTQAEADKLFSRAQISPYSKKFPGSKKPWHSRCDKCGNDISPTYGSLLRGSGCRFCSVAGIKYAEPGFVYLIHNSALNAHKIGIANVKAETKYHDRMKQHLDKGWILIQKLDFATAFGAYEVEQAFLDWVRLDLGLPRYLESSQMPQGGYTETLSGDIEISLLLSKLDELCSNLKTSTTVSRRG